MVVSIVVQPFFLYLCATIKLKRRKHTIMNITRTKEEAIKAAKAMISGKKEVIKWIRSNEPYEHLTKKGIILGRIGK